MGRSFKSSPTRGKYWLATASVISDPGTGYARGDKLQVRLTGGVLVIPYTVLEVSGDGEIDEVATTKSVKTSREPFIATYALLPVQTAGTGAKITYSWNSYQT